MDERLREDLREIDRVLGEVPVPAELERRILRQPARASFDWRVALAAGIAVAVLALTWARPWLQPTAPLEVAHGLSFQGSPADAPANNPGKAERTPAPVTRWSGQLQLSDGCTATGTEQLRLATGCTVALAQPRLDVQVLDEAVVTPAKRGIGITSGLVVVSVEHVEDAAHPVRVEVDGGAIEVTGTRFIVMQGPSAGYVHLIEGAVTYVPSTGQPIEVGVGDPFAWGEGTPEAFKAIDAAADPAAPPVPAQPRGAGREAKTPSAPVPDVGALLDEVASLRRRGLHREAVAVLRRARTGDPDIQEVLSYEEGTLREQYQRTPSVCAYWRGHLARFSDGTYAGAIARRLDKLPCPEAAAAPTR